MFLAFMAESLSLQMWFLFSRNGLVQLIDFIDFSKAQSQNPVGQIQLEQNPVSLKISAEQNPDFLKIPVG